MAGFVNFRIALVVRRMLTMLPALVILALGVSPTSALILSQVVLSFGIPFALVPLVAFTSRRDVMGVHVNRRTTSVVAYCVAALIMVMNAFLIYQQLL
jgi:manganese transport protein